MVVLPNMLSEHFEEYNDTPMEETSMRHDLMLLEPADVAILYRSDDTKE